MNIFPICLKQKPPKFIDREQKKGCGDFGTVRNSYAGYVKETFLLLHHYRCRWHCIVCWVEIVSIALMYGFLRPSVFFHFLFSPPG